MSSYLYLEVYDQLKKMILSQKLAPGSRMPSIRSCMAEMNVSRTTIENAYQQLASEGYIISRPQSGFYVTEIALVRQDKENASGTIEAPARVRYDFASSGVDPSSFRFDLWQRYIKSALRQDTRMLSYGEPQGEADFRSALCDYVRKTRNIICSPDDIVVGAGVQSLLSLLIPLLTGRHTVSFPDGSFLQGRTVFTDYGFEARVRDKTCDVIYVSPAQMTKWGDVMPVKRRLELLSHAQEHGSLILEDDYENEFVSLQQPTPSLFSLARSDNVVYLGSFSRLLLPSIRISFMILPPGLLETYRKKASSYNQTASKAEQIALASFIRDGHLQAQTRRLKRLYAQKMKKLIAACRNVFGPACLLKKGPGGISLSLTVPTRLSGEELQKKAQASGLRLMILSDEEGTVNLLLSCSTLPAEDFEPGLVILKSILQGYV